MESTTSPLASFWKSLWTNQTSHAPKGGEAPEAHDPWARLCTKSSWEADILIEWLQGYEIMARRQDVGIEAYLGGGASTVIWVKQQQLEEAKQVLNQDSNGVS